MVRLLLEFEERSAETLSVIATVQISITFTALPHSFFILISTLKGYQPIRYSQAEADDH